MQLMRQMTLTTAATVLLAATVPSLVPPTDIGAAVLTQKTTAIAPSEPQPDLNIAGKLDVQMMTADELAKFDAGLQSRIKQLHLPSSSDETAALKIMRGLFDSKQAYYGDVEQATSLLIQAINANHQGLVSGEQVLAARHGRVSTRVLGIALDVVIAASVGGGVGAAAALVRRKGKAAAKRFIQQRVSRKLKAMGLGRAAGYANLATDFALAYSAPGSALARLIDSRDRQRNNGWIELW
ncbi:hypothetical protein D3P96_00890 [Weissella viridescens]|uniref:Uncharacterized protein n=1 Tax=Weissella viridescens TaxID=1629 RepID=A0A3P2RIK3_WEIVI|nr:hypothetical protein [Weissella viridescens]RRG18570.1 hypothetical protein D3P96_00890 [Weissella viridescens]